MKNAEQFALEAVGYARARLTGTVKVEEQSNPLFALAEFLDPLQYVLSAWGEQHQGVALPERAEIAPYIFSQLEKECPRLAPYLAKHRA